MNGGCYELLSNRQLEGGVDDVGFYFSGFGFCYCGSDCFIRRKMVKQKRLATKFKQQKK